jgi:trehalose 6-phosphate synthase
VSGPPADAPASTWTRWHSVVEIEGGPVHVSALPLIDEGQPLGFVMLLHDFGFAERRESQIQRLLVGTFAVLALAASVLTVVIRRASWRGWTSELRRVLHGGCRSPSFSH